jgi:hypothetical protein
MQEHFAQMSLDLRVAVRQELRALSGASLSSPAPATIGKSAHDDLMSLGRWAHVSGSSDAVLTPEECEEVKTAAFSNESELVRWFTPRLQSVVTQAADITGFPLVLVNTERHPWVVDPHHGAPSKPDLLVVHPALYTWNKTQADTEKYDGVDFLFGQLADWDLRDSLAAVIEWKVDPGANDFRGLGEVVEYARRLAHPPGADGVTPLDKEAIRWSRFMVADRKKFQLVTFRAGQADSCVYGEWGDSGSRDALVGFLGGPSAAERPWLAALEKLCCEFDVAPVASAESQPCFLGRGACGRVFRVCSRKNTAEVFALKLALGDSGCTSLSAEVAAAVAVNAVAAALPLAAVIRHHTDPDRRFAGLLVQPVGTALPRTKIATKSALLALRQLAQAGLRHGDARFPNAVWTGDAAVWIDLRTTQTGKGAVAFAADVTQFAASLGVQGPLPESAVAAAFASDNNFDALLELFGGVWRDGAH